MNRYPMIIQGGMGAAVSSWPLARAVSLCGQLGVVSGTALATVVSRKLQSGDPGGHYRRAIETFPQPEVAARVIKAWYRPEDQAGRLTFKQHAMYTISPAQDLLELSVAAAYAEVYLAKEGHDGVVGINLMEKIRLPNPTMLYGAMLANVDYVLMGAGIPMEIPGIMDLLAKQAPVKLHVPVDGAEKGEEYYSTFDPRRIIPNPTAELKRPPFLAIIATVVLATALVKKASGRVDGFIIEGPLAGGHNAPPRGQAPLSELGEPVYGPKDEVDLEKIKAIGLPFWLAGSYGAPERLKDALAAGAEGIQVGTAFAYCEESGFTPEIKEKVLQGVADGTMSVFTDPNASPTGFPFKVASVSESLSVRELYERRERICDLGYLRQAYKKEDGTLGYRCPGEPVEKYVKKGGKIEDTEGRKCLCNALAAAVGFSQVQKNGDVERALVTSGDDLLEIGRFFKNGSRSYSAADVVAKLTDGLSAIPPDDSTTVR